MNVRLCTALLLILFLLNVILLSGHSSNKHEIDSCSCHWIVSHAQTVYDLKCINDIHTIILPFWNVVRSHIFSFNKTLMLAVLDTAFRACFGGVCSCTSTNVFHRVVAFYIYVCVCDCVYVTVCVCVWDWKFYFSKSFCLIDFRFCCSCLIDFRLCCCSCVIDFRLCCMYTYCMTYKISLGWC